MPALTDSDIESDPIAQFANWFDAARGVVKPHPHAMAFATATPSGRPSVRMVLMKDFDATGFVFYTNYDSRKGRELSRNARGSLLFYWGALDRQVRVDGKVKKVTRRESDEYFATRARGSQLAAWASSQSAVLPNRAALENNYASAAARYSGGVPRPPYWGGYRLIPETIEFWQGREDRLHDRIRYQRGRNGRWQVERLAP